MSIKKAVDIAEAHEKLEINAKKILKRIKNKKWILDFMSTRSHGLFDSHGIDRIIYFSPDSNGGRGSVCFQEKRSKKRKMREHFKKYPCVPCYLLFTDDSEKEIEYTFLLAMLRSGAFNHDRKEKIKTRFNQLEMAVGNQRYRFARNVQDFNSKKPRAI